MKTLKITTSVPVPDDDLLGARATVAAHEFKQKIANLVPDHFGEGHKVEVTHEIVTPKVARKSPVKKQAPISAVKPAAAKAA